MKRYLSLLICVMLYFMPVRAQEMNPVDIPVSYINGQPYLLRQEDEAAARQKSIKKTLVVQVTATPHGTDTSFIFYKTGYARDGTKFPLNYSFSDSMLSRIVYDNKGHIIQYEQISNNEISCGNNRRTERTRFYIKNNYNGNRLISTIVRQTGTADTVKDTWWQQQYTYDKQGRKIRETMRVENANSSPSSYVSKIKQFAYDRQGRLRWDVELLEPGDTMQEKMLAGIPADFDVYYQRERSEWRDSFLVQEFGKYWKDNNYASIQRREDRDDALLDPLTERIRYMEGYIYNSDGKGRLVKHIHLGEKDLQPHIVVDSFYYDPTGRLIRWKIKDLKHDLKEWHFSYDLRGRVTSCNLIVYSGNGFFSEPVADEKRTKRYTLNYGKDGLLSEIRLRAVSFEKEIDERYIVQYLRY